MNHNQIAVAAPSVFAVAPHGKVSEGYHFVPTNRVLEAFENVNFTCINAKQQKTRELGNEMSTKHTLLLRKNDSVDLDLRGVNVPTVRLTNSHDWSSTFQVSFGMLALMCSNGLYFAGPQYESYSVRHDSIMEDVESIVARFASTANRMNNTIETWAGILLSSDQKREFAKSASAIRFGAERASYDLGDILLETRRRQDNADDLWTVFNTVQENAVRGGVKAGKRRSREIRNIGTSQTINEELFLLAASYA